MIELGKPEIQINNLIELIPEGKLRDESSLQSLFDFEKKFNLEDFHAKVKDIENKFKSLESVAPEISLPLGYSVLESLEKFNFQGRIAWLKEQKFVLIPDGYMDEIKITKDASFVFICKN